MKKVATDDRYAVQGETFRKLMDDDKKAGLIPFFVRTLILFLTSGFVNVPPVSGESWERETRLHKGLWVRISSKACWLEYGKMLLDVIGHSSIFGIYIVIYTHTHIKAAVLCLQ